MVLQGLPTEFADFCVRRWRPKEARTERREASSVILPRGLADRLRAEYPWLTDEDVRRASASASSALRERSARGDDDELAPRPARAPQHLDEAAQDDELVATIYQQLEELLWGWWDSFLLVVCC